jgi:uncharacterized protein (TIGR03437 family)
LSVIRISMAFALGAVVIHAGQLIYEEKLSSNLLAVDSAGNAFVATSAGLTKLNPDGSVAFSKPVVLNGSWAGMAVDGSGNLVIAGTTGSDALPATAGVIQPNRNNMGTCITPDKTAMPYPCPDAFVAKLDASGNLIWATYLGGSAQEQANAVAVDVTGNIFIVGITQSADFPIVAGFQPKFGGYADGFIAKISPDGTKLLYSSFMGGSGYDIAHGVAVDSAGNAYIAGEGPSGWPTTAASFGSNCADSATHAFLLKVSPAGALVYGGCLGSGVTYSAATAVTVDLAGSAYIGGWTNSQSFPVSAGAFDGRSGGVSDSDFVVKVSPDGGSLVYSSLLDGASFGIYSMAVDSTGSVYAGGSTSSSRMPVTGPALQPCPGSSNLVLNFLMKLNPAGSALLYFSFEDADQHSISVAVAPDGSLLEAAGPVRKITNLEQPGTPYLSQFCVLNGASFRSHLQYGQPGISPGEVVTLTGTGLGPATAPSLALVNGLVGNSLGQTQVFFDGIPAPLLYVQDRQINAVAPYALEGKTQTSIQVQSVAGTTQPVTIPVSSTSVAPFMDFTTGAALLFDQDFSLNSFSKPAVQGGAVVLFVTGAGQTAPPSVDGQVWQGTGALQTSVSAELQNISSSPITVTIPVLYAGPVPGTVSAVQQLNFQIPANLPSPFVSGVAAGNDFLNVTIGAQKVSLPVVVH